VICDNVDQKEIDEGGAENHIRSASGSDKMLISIQDGVFMGFMNISQAWRKQVVVQHEKNGNEAALRVRKQRITLLKNAKSRRIFSNPISL
jgi:hypothetical protein